MDASEYLRYKKLSCSQTIARNKCMDAGLRTDILAKTANSTYRSTNSTIGFTPTCCVPTVPETSIRFSNDENIAIKPSERCSVNCSTLTDRYTTPFVVKPGCPIPYMSTTYKSPNCTPCYQATRRDDIKPINNFNCNNNCIPKY